MNFKEPISSPVPTVDCTPGLLEARFSDPCPDQSKDIPHNDTSLAYSIELNQTHGPASVLCDHIIGRFPVDHGNLVCICKGPVSLVFFLYIEYTQSTVRLEHRWSVLLSPMLWLLSVAFLWFPSLSNSQSYSIISIAEFSNPVNIKLGASTSVHTEHRLHTVVHRRSSHSPPPRLSAGRDAFITALGPSLFCPKYGLTKSRVIEGVGT